jgi:hypothetical protein
MSIAAFYEPALSKGKNRNFNFVQILTDNRKEIDNYLNLCTGM